MPYEVWTTRESPRKLNITKEWYAFCIGKFVTGELCVCVCFFFLFQNESIYI